MAEDTTKAGDQTQTNTAAEGAAGDQTQSGEQNKTFTQAEVSAMMAKEKNQGRLAVLKELGVEDAKTAKEGLSKYKEYLDSQKTDLEKAQGETAAEKTARLAAEQKAQLLENSLAAIKLGVKPDCVEDVMALATAKVSDTKSFADVMAELKTKYPSFFGEDASGSGGEANKGTGGNVGSKKSAGTASGLGARLGAQAKTGEQKSSYFNNK